MHLGVHPRLAQQPFTQLRVEVLRPMRQRSHRRAVAPRIQRRNDPAAGPGGFAANIARLQQQHRHTSTRKEQAREKTNNPPSNNNDLRHKLPL